MCGHAGKADNSSHGRIGGNLKRINKFSLPILPFFPNTFRTPRPRQHFFLRYTAMPSTTNSTQRGSRADGRPDGHIDAVLHNHKEGRELILSGGVAQALEEGCELEVRDLFVIIGLLQMGDGLKELCLEGVEERQRILGGRPHHEIDFFEKEGLNWNSLA
jgi:hypothetical protein